MQRITTPLGHRVGRGSDGLDLSQDIPHDYRRRLGAWIREHRMERGLTQKQLAEMVGERQGNTAVSAIEVGRNSIAPERYVAYADALGIPRDEFARFVLRHTDPWIFSMLFGPDGRLEAELAAIPRRRDGGH